jgi:hypothetical protein
MSGFQEISKIIIPLECIQKAYKLMRYAGENGVEGVALFAGYENDNKFYITQTIIPKQTAYRLELGLLYAVDADELHRINVWLYENNLTIISQIHSHPNEAYHSETDDAYPIVATKGGISIVVPRFAIDPVDIKNWAVYRLSSKNYWVKLRYSETNKIIQISDD